MLPMGFFTGHNYYALILGGSSGLGLAAAQKLAAEGMNLCLVHRDRRSALPAFEAAVAQMRDLGVNVATVNRNALQSQQRQATVQELEELLNQRGGKLRLLLHAVSRGNLKRLAAPPSSPVPPAGLADKDLQAALETLYRSSTSGATSEPLLQGEDLRLTIEAMATSLWDWVQALLAAQLFAEDARILGLTSEGNQRAWPYYAAVSAAKVALEALIRAMARELAPHGLRSNVVQAGITDTPSLRLIPGSEQLKASALLRNPFGRLTTPRDVADVIALLCTDEARWVNGALIPVDGGERLG